MKQPKTLRVNTIAKDVDLVITKTKKEITDLELSLADKKAFLEQLEMVKENITK